MLLFLFSGTIAALIAALLELFVFVVSDLTGTATDIVTLSASVLFLFAAVEETVKFGFLRRILVAPERKDSPFVGIGSFALGFGGTELLLALSKFPDAPVISLGGIFILHTATVALYGYALGKRYPRPRLALAVLSGLLLHFFYNLSLA